jgi:hypothetical protein
VVDRPEDQEPFADLISRLLALLTVVFLEDRDLHLELVDPVFEKEDLLGFGVDVHGRQSFQASPANLSRESGSQQHGSAEQGNGGIEVLCHSTSSKGLPGDRPQFERAS